MPNSHELMVSLQLKRKETDKEVEEHASDILNLFAAFFDLAEELTVMFHQEGNQLEGEWDDQEDDVRILQGENGLPWGICVSSILLATPRNVRITEELIREYLLPFQAKIPIPMGLRFHLD